MNTQKRNQVKIISGEHRGRNIVFTESEGLRPTPSRVRETLFNWLGQDLTGFVVLDLFAGSGVLGFEAISRGATEVVMVDNNVQVVKNLVLNKDKMLLQNLTIFKKTAVQFLKSNTHKQFDLIFLDPPFIFDEWANLLQNVKPLLKAGAYLYIEAPEEPEFDADFEEIKTDKAGQSRQWLLQFHPSR